MSHDTPELWKSVVGYEELYEVSNLGRIRSLRKNTRIKNKVEAVMAQKMDDKGYLRVNLHKDGKCTAHLVNRLVAKAFVPNPDLLPYAGHENDTKTDNRADNLYWTDPSENLMHNGLHLAIAKKRNIQAVKDALSIPIVGVDKDKNTIEFPSYQEGERHGFSSGHISQCINGQRLTHGGYRWYRKDEFYGVER